MENQVDCVCDTTYAFRGSNQFRALAENGWFGLDPAYSYSGIHGESSKGKIEFDPIDQFAAEMDAFSRHLLFDEPNRVPGQEGLRDLLAIEAIYRSIETRKTVKVEAEGS